MATFLPPEGVVLDEPMAMALLYVAVQEGLIDGDPRIGDGFVARLLREPPAAQQVEDALEQVVLGGKVFMPFWVPNRWSGELFESGLFVPVNPPNDDQLLDV